MFSIEYSVRNLLNSYYIVAILLLTYILWLRLRKEWTYPIIKALWFLPGPKAIPIFGNVLSVSGTAVERFQKYRQFAKTYPDLYRLWFMNMASVVIFNPDDVEKILTNDVFAEKNFSYSFFSPWLRDGIFTSSDKKKYKQRRKILTSAFNFNMLKEFVNVFERHNSKIADFFISETEKNQTNLNDFLPQSTVHLICETLMGYLVPLEKTKRYVEAIHDYTSLSMRRFYRPWLHSDLVFNLTRNGKKSKHLLNILHDFSSELLDERLEKWDENSIQAITSYSGKRHYAIVDSLIKEMKSGADIDLTGIQEETDTIIFGGYDTTSVVAAFTLMLLANNPEVQEKVLEELRLIFGKSKRNANYEDLQAMNYLEMCIKETLRLFPIPLISRVATKDITFKNHLIPKGVSIIISIFDLHRNPRFWPDPERFDPERFTIENSRDRHPFAFIPFSGGLRNCPGNKYAMLELKSFISNIIWTYEVCPVDTMETIVLYSDGIIRSRDGIKVKFAKRKNE